jgi:hypothetical protein
MVCGDTNEKQGKQKTIYIIINLKGTSQNENIHSRFSALKPQSTSKQTLDSIYLMLNYLILVHNRRYLTYNIIYLVIFTTVLLNNLIFLNSQNHYLKQMYNLE